MTPESTHHQTCSRRYRKGLQECVCKRDLVLMVRDWVSWDGPPLMNSTPSPTLCVSYSNLTESHDVTGSARNTPRRGFE